FFFSSRRRHTRFDCDWSSDVCSSDLEVPRAFRLKREALAGGTHRNYGVVGQPSVTDEIESVLLADLAEHVTGTCPITTGGNEQRSEERRVGKECRSRRGPEH